MSPAASCGNPLLKTSCAAVPAAVASRCHRDAGTADDRPREPLGSADVIVTGGRGRDRTNPITRKRTAYRPAAGCLSLAMLAGLALAGLPARPGGATVQPHASTGAAAATSASPRRDPAPAVGDPLIAADYFGIANPYNFWSSDISGAPQAFQQMKADGFNAVGLVLPWGEAEPSLEPPRFNTAVLARLDHLIALASKLHLAVVLRLSYSFDVDPADQLPWTTRTTAVFADPKVYQAWLAYISKVHESVARFPNVKLTYLSWEDFWQPEWEAQHATSLSERLHLATAIGYRQWLQATYSLAQVSYLYGASFSSWSQVPTPLSTQPAFELVLRFIDAMVVNRFFLPAQKRFPGLTLEARVDVDSVYNGQQTVGTYTHAPMYRLPGTSLTGMYFSPYMHDPSTSHDETVQQALDALKNTLYWMALQSGGRRLYIYEFEFMSNASVISKAPTLKASHIPAFLELSAPLLRSSTAGYALWTYRDFTISPVYNPSFSLGRAGWSTHGRTTAVTSATTTSYLAMDKNASVSQAVDARRLMVKASAPVTVSVQAWAKSSGELRIGAGSAPATTVQVHAGWHTYDVQCSRRQLASGRVTLTAVTPLRVTNVQVYGFTQLGDIYGADGAPQPGLGALRVLNAALTKGTNQ